MLINNFELNTTCARVNIVNVIVLYLCNTIHNCTEAMSMCFIELNLFLLELNKDFLILVHYFYIQLEHLYMLQTSACAEAAP